MAQRRMFSLKIIDTDTFLEMPHSSQLLYFHLAMRADDDGFIDNPKKIIKMTNANEGDIQFLIVKKLIIAFESGICVIRDWKIHNYIQSDRYTPTLALTEKTQLTTEKETQKYILKIDVSKMDTQVRLGKVNNNGHVSKMDTERIQDVSKMDTETSQTQPTQIKPTENEAVSKMYTENSQNPNRMDTEKKREELYNKKTEWERQHGIAR